ncbi:hypothetical protein A2380_02025 [candidate division WWE3 bacterium RIFOXYB1_FULL_43_24]|uniref:Uncharacterized protein n=2 Tax=Katanobacteria TaxID=422282 RepID=A0A0G0YPR7_UNCKA|nr:MAG: hypothetical protein UU92_C0002G0078 [candidate division WWE3 bacterium GW2011_GWA1_42_12]KKS34302.1 MAG: hypothetical protein UU97_C0012G0002 [candidate division WWE3 bacterium GW2011_GWD1_42_14]KKS38604.1 MAG: hypothetical protein UV00_C0006G0002 [candidate division WWE3 bacterium GW2011_GWF1_42_14]KKS40443.1 MAG: hypothetical protein UV03_C0007G0078 [candidate division WWE3 bacterium GW2011_GWE1_42_16]KKS66340.1 MAG: hypothetical protein UV35_C0018G0019 [candidate division WWE3 bacte
MPVLAAYIGYSGVSVALEKPDGSFDFQRFPYSYSRELFSSVCDENGFYTQVLEGIAKENKAKLADFDLLMTGFVNFPLPDLDIKLMADVRDLLSKHEENFPVLVDEVTVLTKDVVLSQVPIEFLTKNEHFANISIYPQLITRDYNDQVSLDGLIIDKVKKAGTSLTSDKPVLFTGDRFARRDFEPVFKYSLALDLFSNPGYYYVKIDKNNATLLSQLIKEYNPNINVDTSKVIEEVGTFAIVPGDTEVLLSTVLDTGQFFDIEKNSVFAVPLDNSIITKLSVKNKSIGNLEGGVVGGTLGLLFDTREERHQLISDIKIMNAFMREIEEAVKGI